MKIQPKISITLLAYNVEQYIADSLDRIINQTLKEIEIICFHLKMNAKKLNQNYIIKYDSY